MRKNRVFVAFSLAALVSGSLLAAPLKVTPSGAKLSNSPAEHVSQLDGPLTMLTSPTGRTVAAWAYRAKGEYDVAVAVQDSASGTWSEPVYFGRRNNADESEPAVTFDSHGTAYLAYVTSNPSRVVLTALPAGASTWMDPVVVSGADSAGSPSLLIVGDRLVVAFRSPRGIAMRDLTLADIGSHTDGVQDGPDCGDGMGVKGRAVISDVTPVGPGH